MEMTQPTNEIITNNILAEQAKIDILRNNQTIIEAEITRLKNLINTEKNNIATVVGEKMDLESKITVLTETVAILKDEKESLENAVSNLRSIKISLESQIAINQSKISSEKIEIEELKNKLNEQITNFNSNKEIFDKKNEEFLIKEKELDEKISKLKEIIK